MSKADTTPQATEEQKTTFKLIMDIKTWVIRCAFLGIIGYGGYWLYQNPNVWQKYLQSNEKLSEQNEVLVIQMGQLQNQVASLQSQILNIPEPDLSKFEEKVESLEKQNLNVIDSKADAAIVLGMLTRVDKLENRLDKLAKISDDGALILSAAMLVKQAAEEGGDFIYEAEILNQLTPATAPIKKDVAVISEDARTGIACKNMLLRRFREIYAAAQQPEEEVSKDWKARLNDKLNEYIKINKTGEHVQEVEQKHPLEDLAVLVNDGQLKGAVKLIESSDNDDIKQNQLLQEWLSDTRRFLAFKQAIRNIAAYSLAEMKVNNLKNKE